MDIERELRVITTKKKGNKEIALFFNPYDNVWSIHLGNPSAFVLLGEVDGEIEVEDETIPGAIIKLKKKLEVV